MEEPKWRELRKPTEEECVAARAYTSESGFYHLAMGPDFSAVTEKLHEYNEFIVSGRFKALQIAIRECFELQEDAILWSGHGNGVGVFGSFGHSSVTQFIGMCWQYRGFTSTSLMRLKAEDFLKKRAQPPASVPALLEFRMHAGSRLFPISVLGADQTHEGEFLLPASGAFKVIDAATVTLGSALDVRHLVLKPA